MSTVLLRPRKRDRLIQTLRFRRSTSPGNAQPSSSNALTLRTSLRAGLRTESAGTNTPSTTPHTILVTQLNATVRLSSASKSTDLAGNAQPESATTTSTTETQGLWLDALHSLSEAEQLAIQSLQPTLDTEQPLPKKMDDLLQLTKEFKQIGDIASNVDPIHAGLPWAGIRFLLQAAIGEHEQMGFLVTAIEKLSYLMNRGAIYERLYPPGTIPEHVMKCLEEALVQLYSVMFQIIALCHRRFAENTSKRAFHAILNPDEVSTLLDKCERLEVRVEHEAQNCERTRSQEVDAVTRRLLEFLEKPILRIDERVLSFLEKMGDRERLEILDWTSNVFYGTHHETVKNKRTLDTCEWLLSHSRFQEWQEPSLSIIFWLRGTAGTGKTFLTSKVIDEVQSALKRDPNQGFAFFYCKRNEPGRGDPLSVLKAYVRQLSTIAGDSHSIQRSVKQFYNEARQRASQLTMNDCKKLLLDFINIYPQTTLILDALDECESQSRVELIEIFECLLSEAEEAKNPLKIFISSRPDDDIKRKLKHHANIEITATDNHEDITRFVGSRISKHPTWHMTVDSELQKKNCGNITRQKFQWAFLQLEQLLTLDLKEDILDRLGKLPDDLIQTYDEIYNSMTKVERRIADRAFQWVMCACKPLETKELLPAICQDENSDTLKPLSGLDEDLVLKYCHNLLVIDSARQVWIPSHLSVIEYFENHLWSQSQANCLVASVCLLLLNNTVLYDREEKWVISKGSAPGHANQYLLAEGDSGRDDPLLDQGFKNLSLYARHYWPIHTREIDTTENKKRLSILLECFLGLPTDSSAEYRCWHRMVTKEENKLPGSSVWRYPLLPRSLESVSISSFAFCAFALDTVLPTWHDFNWVKLDNRTKYGDTYLSLAASVSNSVTTCRHLVKHGAEVNMQTANSYGSALAAAVFGNKKEIVKLLIKEGAEVDKELQYGNYGSALAAAALGWRGNEVVELLIKEGAEVNKELQHGDYGSALAAAAAANWGRKKVVKLLVEEGGADVNAKLQYGKYRSALHAAKRKKKHSVVELLINYGVKEEEESEEEESEEEESEEEESEEEEADEDSLAWIEADLLGKRFQVTCSGVAPEGFKGSGYDDYAFRSYGVIDHTQCRKKLKVSNAYVSGMKEDLKLTGNDLNLLTTYWIIGYIIGQFPSQTAMSKIRPSIWLPAMEIIWSILTICVAGTKNIETVYALVLRIFTPRIVIATDWQDVEKEL
ncbi:hypothetical protein G7Y89_g2417 [Cudoniella acicularis]|uniref:NACHT domain-containing protein n=1 Tax=Cudoniella acicularis TaxID=354080 RepID=A0A8H4RUH3_9HELO|nr:hypothetical protein G7Y89_g2417 [Cudoniella acicularis]